MQGNTTDQTVHLRSMLNQPAADRSTHEESGLPSLNDGEYQAHARPSNRPLYAIHFVTLGGDVRTFQYVHLDSNSQYTAEQITLAFMGMEPVKVVIEGRNLRRLYDDIHQHRMPWVMVAGRDFAKDSETIVTRVVYHRPKDEEQE